MSIHGEALSAIRALREWIKAVPADVAAALPAMPGVDADWLDMVEGELVMFVELEGAHADAHARFGTLINGQRIAGLGDQRQNEPQIIPETISAPQRATERMPQAPIPVSERLPVDGQDVLFKVQELRDGKPYGNHGRWFGGRFRNEAGRPTFSTPGVGWQASHWLPMPPQCINGGG